MKKEPLFALALALLTTIACQRNPGAREAVSVSSAKAGESERGSDSALIRHLYTADPSAHVFGGRLYIYPSHDIESGVPADDQGSHFDMKDYHVFSLDSVGAPVTDHGVALALEDIPWAGRQLWAPDAAEKDGTYYLYFPAKDRDDIFRIGVATAANPEGPFTARPDPIPGSFSMDPAVFQDTDGSYYMYFGGIWGGQLQRWESGAYQPEDVYPSDDAPAISPKMARLADDMTTFAEPPRDVQILDASGQPLKAGDNERRFFEAAWVHKYGGRYYLSYSTGDTHNIAYATADNPYGPFTYQGGVLKPVVGWTNHHSIVTHLGKWYLFYHDSSCSGGQTHLRCVKVSELTYREDGSIATLDKLVSMPEE